MATKAGAADVSLGDNSCTVAFCSEIEMKCGWLYHES